MAPDETGVHGMQKVRGSNPLSSTMRFSRFSGAYFHVWVWHSGFLVARGPVPGGLRARAGPGLVVCGVSGRAVAWSWRLSWLVVAGAGLVVVAVAGQGGPAASPARVLRRR